MSTLTRVRSLLFHAWSYPATNPQWSTKTATCAAGCGLPVPLGEPHYTVVRNAEVVEANGTVAPLDGDELAVVHIDCWPDENGPIAVEARVVGPGSASVRRSAGLSANGALTPPPSFVERVYNAYALIERAEQFELCADWQAPGPDGTQQAALYEAFELIGQTKVALNRILYPPQPEVGDPS